MKANGAQFKFVATHLESPLPNPYDLAGDYIIPKSLQEAQADELMSVLKKSRFPVILAGDFNSDAAPTHIYPPDVTLSYSEILAAGFSDAWGRVASI
jgi:hypothetical protein